MTKLTYHGLKTTRASVENSPLMNASKPQLKARKSNTEWKEQNESLGTMNFDFDYDPSSSPSRQEGSWESGF